MWSAFLLYYNKLWQKTNRKTDKYTSVCYRACSEGVLFPVYSTDNCMHGHVTTHTHTVAHTWRKHNAASRPAFIYLLNLFFKQTILDFISSRTRWQSTREGKATEAAINPPIVLSTKCRIFTALCNSDRRKSVQERACRSDKRQIG